MRITRTSKYRWLPVRIDDFEKWQSGLLEESARRLGALLDPGGRVHRWGFVGSPAMFRGQRAWLRVSPFLEHEEREGMAGHRRGDGNPGSQQARAAPPDRVAHRRTAARAGQRRSPHACHRPARLPGAVLADGPRPFGGLVQRPAHVACGAARVSD